MDRSASAVAPAAMPVTARHSWSLSDDDAALVAQARRELPQRSRAFEALYVRYEERVRRSCRRHLGDDEHSVDDAHQEIFLRVFHALPRFRGESSFSSWLFRICLNVCHSHGTARSRWQRRFASCTRGFDIDAAPPDVIDDEDEARQRQQLAQVMHALREQDRLLLGLRYLEGCSLADIGERLQLKNSAVKMRLHRAEGAARQLAQGLSTSC